MKAIEIVKGLLIDGHDIAQCLDFLCDGEALANFGVDDQFEVEQAFYFLATINNGK